MSTQEILTLLEQVGVTSATVTYDGASSEGGVTGMTIAPTSGYKKSQTDWRTEISNYVDQLIFDEIDENWDEGYGGFGTVTIDVTNSRVTIDHLAREINEIGEQVVL